MSGYKTHMVIGAVGGLGLALLLDARLPQIGPPLPLIPNGYSGLGLIAGSAVLATWPDIDQGQSWIAQRSRRVLTVVSSLALGAGGVLLAEARQLGLAPITAGLIGLVLGGLFGWFLLSKAVLRLIRELAGGHRRLTHSAVLSVALLLVAALLAAADWSRTAVGCAALVWGQFLHVLGDLVTVDGVPLLYPFSRRSQRILPRPLARIGEPIAFVVACVLGFVFMFLAT